MDAGGAVLPQPIAAPRARVRLAPARSAQRTLTAAQIFVFAALAAGLIWSLLTARAVTQIWLHAAILFVFGCAIGVRIVAAAASLAPQAPAPPPWQGPLPRYTLLCPLFLEADIAPDLVAALARLDYPPELHDVKLIVEEDDVETRAALLALDLPCGFAIVVVPPGARAPSRAP